VGACESVISEHRFSIKAKSMGQMEVVVKVGHRKRVPSDRLRERNKADGRKSMSNEQGRTNTRTKVED
jgi:hypothetical protein